MRGKFWHMFANTKSGITFEPNRLHTIVQAWTRQVSVIAVDPRNDSNWYVGSGQFWRVKETHRSSANLTGTHVMNTDYGHVFVSKDKGASWSTVAFDPLLDVAKIFVDPESSDIVYVSVTPVIIHMYLEGACGAHMTQHVTI
jgi:hypothetical protein